MKVFLLVNTEWYSAHSTRDKAEGIQEMELRQNAIDTISNFGSQLYTEDDVLIQMDQQRHFWHIIELEVDAQEI